MTCSYAFSQDNNSILWEISGNGLDKSSYLFGTIHITDKRVFDFPDSALAKLRECPITAFELNFDSIMGQVLNKAVKKEEAKRLQDLLNKEEMDKIKEALKKMNIKTDNLNNESPVEIYRKYNFSFYKNKDMSTFLDAYLFGIAKQLDKTIIGIETYAEQADLIDDMKEEDQRKLLLRMGDSVKLTQNLADTLLAFYLQQNINKLYNLLHNNSGDNFEDVFLIKRNYVMCRRIDSLIQKTPAFICIGSGHFGGNEGLINLLQKKGYRVTALKSPKTGYYKKLLPVASGFKSWKTVYDEGGGYKVKMPGEPSPVSTMGVEMKGYMDFGSGYFYMSTAVPASSDKAKSSERIMKAIKEKFEEKGKVLSQKSVKVKDAVGYDIEVHIDKVADYVVRVISDTSRTFMLMIGVNNKKPEKAVVKAFFESLDIVQRVAPDDIIFKDDTAAFIIASPANFKLITNEKLVNEKYYKTYSSFDYFTQGALSVTYLDYSPGFLISDLDVLYTNSFTTLKNRLGAEELEKKDFMFKGYAARDYLVQIKNGFLIYIRYVLRGTRLYLISSTSKDFAQKEKMITRLNGFDFISPIRTKPVKYSSPEKDFTALMLSSHITTEIDSGNYPASLAYEYASKDDYSNNWFKIYSRVFSKYKYLKNDSAIIHYLGAQLISENDSVLDSSVVIHNKKKYYSFKSIPKNNTGFIKNSRVLVNGKKYYILSKSADINFPNDSLDNALFDSFELTGSDKSFDINAKKEPVLFSDLQSSDTAVSNLALNTFKYYKLESSDLPALEKILRSTLCDDSTENTYRYQVYKKILSLVDSTQLIDYIKKEYSAMPDGPIRSLALDQLAKQKTVAAIDTWKELLINRRPAITDSEFSSVCSGAMSYDSIPLIARLYPDILRLLADTNYDEMVYNISANGLNYKIITPDVFTGQKDQILQYALSEYEKMKSTAHTETPYYSYAFNDALSILNQLPADLEILKLNKKIIIDSAVYDKTPSFVYLVKNGAPVPNKYLKKYLSYPPNRNKYYDELKNLNRLDAFPSDMKKQKLLAEGDIYTVGANDYEITKVEFTGEQKIEFKGQTSKFFIYKVFYGENPYFGLAGPFPLDDKQLISHGSSTTVNFEEYDSKSVSEHIEAVLSQD
jgi:uncharacterized protein YbaP (TraB family)